MSDSRVTDHADTYWTDLTDRAYAEMLEGERLDAFMDKVRAEVAKLRAERQQAQEQAGAANMAYVDCQRALRQAQQERDKLQADIERWELREAEDGLVAENERLRAERQQAIDALRQIAWTEGQYARCLPDCVEGPPTCGCAERIAHAALVKLGEKP